jgi:hypothetical protein
VIDGALAAARAAHFAAVLLLQGGIMVRFIVAADALKANPTGNRFSPRCIRLTAAAWLVAVVSGAAWLMLIAAELDDSSALHALNGAPRGCC